MFYNSPVKIWRNQKKIAQHLGKTGIIETFTLIRVPPAGFERTEPYPVVVVMINSREKLVGQLVDYADSQLKIGQKVEVVLRRIKETDKEGVIPYGVKFKPISQ